MTSVSAANAVLSIAGVVQIEAGFSFSESPSVVATLSNGSSATLQVTTIAFTNVQAFVGDGPYFDVTSSGTFAVSHQPQRRSASLLSGVNLSIALFRPTDARQ